MKSWLIFTVNTLAVMCVGGCHRTPAALSAEGKEIKAGQTAYATQSSFACYSADELRQALELRAQQASQQLRQFFNDDHCGIFQDNERVQVMRLEPGDGYMGVVVNDLDDKSAPSPMWVKSDQLSVRD